MAELIVREPGRVAYRVALRDEVVIGRDPGCDLVLADRQVSRRHVAVRAEAGGHRLVDLGSTHGVLINGQPSREHALRDGDVVQVGNVVFGFRAGGDAEPSLLHRSTMVVEPRAKRADTEGRRLHILGDLATALASLAEPDRLVHAILDAAIAGVDGTGGVVGLADGATPTGRRIGRATDEIAIDRAVIEAVVGRREAVVAGHTTWSAVAAPLVAGASVLGYLYVEERGRRARFTADDLEFLVAIAGIAAAALTQALAHRRALDWIDALRRGEGDGPDLVGDSPPLRALLERIRRFAAAAYASVLIRGETGTGKELVARAVHAWSPRADQPFIAFNCAAIPDAMIESELFGHERGAFTGADRARRGRFALADGGTLFLDEIGDLSPAAQAKVLRALEEREVLPLGGDRPIAVDVRVVAATHRPLEDAIAAGGFRADLYYRLAVAELTVPPLRDRGDDVIKLAESFLATAAARHGRAGVRLAPAALPILRSYPWPGNVRQLRNEIERALLLADGDQIDLDDLRLRVGAARPGVVDDLTAMESGERKLVEQALRDHAGNIKAAAKALGVSRGTLYRKIEKYGLRSAED